MDDEDGATKLPKDDDICHFSMLLPVDKIHLNTPIPSL
jgi:hypothetical protein